MRKGLIGPEDAEGLLGIGCTPHNVILNLAPFA